MKGTFRIEAILDTIKEKGIDVSINNDTLRDMCGITSVATRTDGSILCSSFIIARTNYMSPDLAEELVANALLWIIDRAEEFLKEN